VGARRQALNLSNLELKMETEKLKQNQLGVTEPNRGTIAARTERSSGRKAKLLVLFALVVVGAAAVFTFLKSRGINLQPGAQPVVTVAAAKVTRQDVYDEVPIPAEFRPYVESELHAMVTGYVSQMNVDFGDKVKQGQMLATLEVPELTDQLHNAEATLQQADADYANAHLIYTRLQEVNQQHPKLVAQQDIDTAQSKDASSAGAIAAAKANVEKYQTLVNYTKIVAPFDGVITQRSADPGALVQAGTSSDRSMPLVRVSDNYHLRLDFPVSVEYVKDVHIGDPVTVRVDSLGGKTFVGKITRFTDEVNDETRTMTTEMELDNPDLEIVPGMYAVALFKFEQHSNALTVPTEAVSNPKDPVVYVINADNEIEARPVKLGVEMPDKYEITDGLKEGELVMIGSTSQVHPGQKVEPKLVTQPTIQ
jgi:RND family efflux transporter MFP subunit